MSVGGMLAPSAGYSGGLRSDSPPAPKPPKKKKPSHHQRHAKNPRPGHPPPPTYAPPPSSTVDVNHALAIKTLFADPPAANTVSDKVLLRFADILEKSPKPAADGERRERSDESLSRESFEQAVRVVETLGEECPMPTVKTTENPPVRHYSIYVFPPQTDGAGTDPRDEEMDAMAKDPEPMKEDIEPISEGTTAMANPKNDEPATSDSTTEQVQSDDIKASEDGAPVPFEPVSGPIEPAPEPVNPILEPAEPVQEPIDSMPEPTEPVSEPSDPAPEPVKAALQPVDVISEPADAVSEPVHQFIEPIDDLPDQRIQRIFTTPDGQTLTVLESPNETLQEATDVTDTSPTNVYMIAKNTVAAEDQPLSVESVTTSDQPPMSAKELIDVEESPTDNDETSVVDQQPILVEQISPGEAEKPPPTDQIITVIDEPIDSPDDAVPTVLTVAELPSATETEETLNKPKESEVVDIVPKTEGVPEVSSVVDDDTKCIVMERTNTIQPARTTETTITELPSAASDDIITRTIKPRAATICAVSTIDHAPANTPYRSRSVYTILPPAPSLASLDPPAAVFTSYIASTETRLLLNRHLIPTRDAETHRITDDRGTPIFHVRIAAYGPLRHARQILYSSASDENTPILTLRPRRFRLAGLMPAQWYVDAAGDQPRRVRAVLKRRARWAVFPAHGTAVTGTFARTDTGLAQKFYADENLMEGAVGGDGGTLRLAPGGEVVAVVQPVLGTGRVKTTVMSTPTTAAAAATSAGVTGELHAIRVAQGFDLAFACAVVVAMDERKWWWWDRRRSGKAEDAAETEKTAVTEA